MFLRESVCLVLGIALFGLCLEWYRAVRRRCSDPDSTVRASARWNAYELVWSVCVAGGGLAVNGILLAAAYIKFTDGSESSFEALARIPIAMLLASALLALKARFAPFAVCVTGEWWLGSYAVTGDLSLHTPIRVLFESFTDFLPDPIRLVWALVTLGFLTLSWLRALDAKAEFVDVVV